MYRETENISRHFFLFSSFGKFIRNKHVPLGTAIRRFGQLSKGRYISTKNKWSLRFTFRSFNFRITKCYSESNLIAHHRSDTRYVSLAIVGFNDRNNRMKTKREKIAANRKDGHLALSFNEFTTSRILRSISNKETRMAIRLFRNGYHISILLRLETKFWREK